MKYLLAGSVALAMYGAVMIRGGMLYIDDEQEIRLRSGVTK
jgi:hypothetical protein